MSGCRSGSGFAGGQRLRWSWSATRCCRVGVHAASGVRAASAGRTGLPQGLRILPCPATDKQGGYDTFADAFAHRAGRRRAR